ncbi:uncharacterized protein LOC126907801 isoform X2 [Daktulosphaira vitifoliae]|uniref:uncharacterized protein LOC126907801 isoform X2 n=1 Tax=Daktulosphaira vitifoliae TaxID=58002 RepID=UPI0021AACEFD|nr:uncharacterized protein LOC126907801 isoform X2 [Daktulosphaira vitifoliae]
MSLKVLRTNIYLIGNYSHEITGSKLPSNLQVLKTLFFNLRVVKLNVRQSALLVLREVMIFWDKARIPTMLERNCVEKIERLYEEWRLLQKHTGRITVSHKEKVDAFTLKFNNLFDIAHTDALSLIKIDEDRLFLLSQREEGRPGFLHGISNEINYNNDNEEIETESINVLQDLEISMASTTLSENSDTDVTDNSYELPPPKKLKGKRQIITPKLVCVMTVVK